MFFFVVSCTVSDNTVLRKLLIINIFLSFEVTSELSNSQNFILRKTRNERNQLAVIMRMTLYTLSFLGNMVLQDDCMHANMLEFLDLTLISLVHIEIEANS